MKDAMNIIGYFWSYPYVYLKYVINLGQYEILMQ
jgi:hypothetical protein